MKILFLNVVYGFGSTGNIVKVVSEAYSKQGAEVLVAYGRNRQSGSENTFYFGSKIGFYWHVIMSVLFGRHGLHSTFQTRKLIKKIKEFEPDVIHLHNLHGYYLNVRLLMKYLKTTNIRLVYVLHDCWTVSGSSAHFDYYGCKEWDNGCVVCNNTKEYPSSLFYKRQKKNFKWKKEVFCGHKNMTIITVSNWMAHLISTTFLNEYKIERIYNGIDLSIFSVNDQKTLDRNRIKLLGVASAWSNQKGLEDFVSLSKRLSNAYQITLIGLTQKQIKSLPKNIIGIERTNSKQELADYYKNADIYLNLSVEETMGLTTVEAMACGTPCIVYDRTAVPEIVSETSGIIVEATNIDKLVDVIENFNFENFNGYKVKERAECFTEEEMIDNYLKLY